MTDGKSPAVEITLKEFGRRFRKALYIPFELQNVCPGNVKEFVNAYSTAIGCSEKSFFYPFLTCVAACMGSDSYIELSTSWQEPIIIWTLVITPNSLLRTNVAEHLRQELLKVEQEVWLSSQNATSNNLKKFIFDITTRDQLHDLLKANKGHGVGIYDSIRTLHNCMEAPEGIDILRRLHYGLSWFKDSQHRKSTLTKTRVNLSVSCPTTVIQQTLNTAANFHGLMFQCFLTVCAEEIPVKFSQISDIPEREKLGEIFRSVLKLHSSGRIIYKLSTEANEKFGQIHDELTDKAKQMNRKTIDDIENKIFQPALPYLARLSCVLHVLENIIESLKDNIPLSHSTWNTEVNAENVSNAREILAHVVEQRCALIENTALSFRRIQPINLVDEQGSPPRNQQIPQVVTSNSSQVNQLANQPIPQFNLGAGQGNNSSVQRNLMSNTGNHTTNKQFDLFRNQNNNAAAPAITPCIASVSSAGVLIQNKQAVVKKNASVRFSNMSSALSVSIADAQPILTRTPHVSVLDISDDDFMKSYKNEIKRILIHSVSRISPARCALLLKLIFNQTNSDSQPSIEQLSFARTFLKKLERMGFGVCEGQKKSLRQFIFRKKKFSELADIQIKMLSTLGINKRDYN